jgi:hypothetical protein
LIEKGKPFEKPFNFVFSNGGFGKCLNLMARPERFKRPTLRFVVCSLILPLMVQIGLLFV